MTATQIAIDPATIATTLLTDDMTIEQWTEYGRSLFAAEKQIGWAIADWWAFGEKRYGERAKFAAENVLGMSFGALRNAGSVARAFPEVSRQHDVSFTHHQEVAALARKDPEAATEVLQAAAETGMTKMQVREAVRDAREDFTPRPVVDPEYQEFLAIARAWNNARPSVREDVAFIIAEIGSAMMEV